MLHDSCWPSLKNIGNKGQQTRSACKSSNQPRVRQRVIKPAAADSKLMCSGSKKLPFNHILISELNYDLRLRYCDISLLLTFSLNQFSFVFHLNVLLYKPNVHSSLTFLKGYTVMHGERLS